MLVVDGPRRFCVCVPAKNEEERLPRLLKAIAQQSIEGEINLALCINNTGDKSESILSHARKMYAGRLNLLIEYIHFPAPLAHAGSARRAAMDLGCKSLEHQPEGVLLATDADCCPPANWITANLGAIRPGVSLVGGRLRLDSSEPIAADLKRVCQMWDDYWHKVRLIEDSIDPIDWDRQPRHGDHTGGSLAITVAAYHAAGGVPLLPTGEDRGLVNAALAAGYRLRHPIEVWTSVSHRLLGRVEAGMASGLELMALRLARGEEILAPDWSHWRARANWRLSMRADFGIALLLAEEMKLPAMPCDASLSHLLKADE